MKIYFLSSRPCALTINGVFYGVTDNFERSAELTLSDRLYIQFSPEGAQPIGFFTSESLSQIAPDGCDVYLLKDGLAIYAHDFPPSDFTLRPIAQKRQGDTLVTVFHQGKTQLCVNTPENTFNAYIPPTFEKCSIDFYEDWIILSGESLGVFTKECKPILVEKILSFSLEENTLRAALPLSDRLGRIADCAWTLSNGECKLTEFTLRQSPQENKVPPDLLAYAFFESILLKADYSAFLSDELQAESEQIVAFLGDFTAVTLTKNEKECGLIRNKGERIYEVAYFSVEIQDGKITDVRG